MTRKAYEGSRRKIVFAFDIGTTYSGISYSILEPGQVPSIKSVTRFPGQDRSNTSYRIPSIIYYNRSGSARVIGAEASRDGIEIEARERGWVKVEWFKLHMSNTQKIVHPLPTGKRAVDVFADYLRYLYICAAQYVCDAHVGGHTLWKSVKEEVDYVLSHPNGWGGREQSMMREAALLAGLISRQDDYSRLTFVSEGEASLHFCIHSGILKKSDMKDNSGFIIVDAGGGTIDISAYRQKPGDDPNILEEIARSQCLFHGSVYVNLNAKKFLIDLLRNSRFADDIDHLVNVFDQSAKVRFKTDQDPQYIKFGSVRDEDVSLDIKFGQLKLSGLDVASFFRPSIEGVVEALQLLQRDTVSKHSISRVLFVGGFSGNDWFFNNVSKLLKEKGISSQIVRPEEHTVVVSFSSSKAVADGAMSFFLDHFVTTRISKAFYGVSTSTLYDANNMEHLRRAWKASILPDGQIRVKNHFSVILPRKTPVSESQSFRQMIVYFYDTPKCVPTVKKVDILCYKGFDIEPRWVDIDAGKYVTFCTVEADLTSIPCQKKKNAQGNIYYKISLDIILFFGLTEIKVQIAWKDTEGLETRYVTPDRARDVSTIQTDVLCRGPATIIYHCQDDTD